MHSLTFVDGTTNNIFAAASSSINNMITVTMLQLVNMVTISPTIQRNFWGKSTGANRYVGSITASNNLSMVYAGGTQNATATAAPGDLPNWAGGKWMWVASTISFGTNAPRLYTGDTYNPLQEARAYVTQTNGSGTHDDSGDGLWIMNSSGGGIAPDANLAAVMMWNRVLCLEELIEFQFRPRKRKDDNSLVLFWRVGRTGAGLQLDLSGHNNNGTVTGATVGPVSPLALPPGTTNRAIFDVSVAASVGQPTGRRYGAFKHISTFAKNNKSVRIW